MHRCLMYLCMIRILFIYITLHQESLTEETKAVLSYKKTYRTAKTSYLNRMRWAVSLLYFSMGLTFATWASRIADIQTALGLSKANLGTVLFALPAGQLLTMYFSGKLAAKYGSHKTLIPAIICYILSLTTLGLAGDIYQLSAALFLFGVCSNFTNISLNTQGVLIEGLFKKPIMASFHGAWSLAGFTGALISLGMLQLKLSPFTHFAIVTAMLLIVVLFNYKYLVKAKVTPAVKEKGKSKSKINPVLLWLGIIGFCCMLSEGIMFDWSVVYFEDVIKVTGPLKVLGYTSFMIMMASGRFIADKIILRFGRKRVLQTCGLMITTGLYIAVLFPQTYTVALAFMLVGLGVSAVVPTVYGIAGRTPGVSPSIALTTVSSISFLGFMIGPPVIGYIAQAWGLQFSFGLIGLFGVVITLLVSFVKAIE